MVKYKKHLVAFIDILGFKDLINENDPKKIFKLLSVREEIEKIIGKDKGSLDLKISSFSDCIVLSMEYESNDYKIFNRFLQDISFYSLLATMNEHLIRGGFTIGDLYHDESKVFGPALNKAYVIETNQAVYPRIIFDTEVVKELKEFKKKITSGHYIKVLNSYTTRYEDGQYGLDASLVCSGFVSESIEQKKSFIVYLNNVAHTIVSGYNKHIVSPCIFKKYQWLLDRYNENIRKIEKGKYAININEFNEAEFNIPFEDKA